MTEPHRPHPQIVFQIHIELEKRKILMPDT